ncbi:MAG: hypothetical protein HY525_10460 [Betaproteobacteria bacterium]|nr:hypothetical protein [Betaproteobacteria bacterium]
MDFATIISSAVIAVLGSSVVAGLVAALVTLRTSERGIKIENITKERAKWREKVREKALEVHKAAQSGKKDRLLELYLEFSLILNPIDGEDHAILTVLETISTNPSSEEKLKEFVVRLALLLKHDWERAKLEAEPVWWRACRKASRVSYAEWQRSRAS